MEGNQHISAEGIDVSPFGERLAELVSESRGILSIIKSIRPAPDSKFAKLGDDPLYRTAIRRLRDNGIKMASFAEASALLLGRGMRDKMLAGLDCRWDDSRKRVDLGVQKKG